MTNPYTTFDNSSMDDSGEHFRPERGKTLTDFYRTMEEGH